MKMKIFLKIFSDQEKLKDHLDRKKFPENIVGDYLIMNLNNPKQEELRQITKNVLVKYINIFGNQIFYKLKKKISNLNDLFIAFYFYKLETCNNIEIDPGNLDKKWTIKCLNMMKEQFPEEFLKKYNYKGVSFKNPQLNPCKTGRTMLYFYSCEIITCS